MILAIVVASVKLSYLRLIFKLAPSLTIIYMIIFIESYIEIIIQIKI